MSPCALLSHGKHRGICTPRALYGRHSVGHGIYRLKNERLISLRLLFAISLRSSSSLLAPVSSSIPPIRTAALFRACIACQVRTRAYNSHIQWSIKFMQFNPTPSDGKQRGTRYSLLASPSHQTVDVITRAATRSSKVVAFTLLSR